MASPPSSGPCGGLCMGPEEEPPFLGPVAWGPRLSSGQQLGSSASAHSSPLPHFLVHKGSGPPTLTIWAPKLGPPEDQKAPGVETQAPPGKGARPRPRRQDRARGAADKRRPPELRPLPAPRSPLPSSPPAPRGPPAHLLSRASGSPLRPRPLPGTRHPSGSPAAPVSSHSHRLLGPLQRPAAPPRRDRPWPTALPALPGFPSSCPPCPRVPSCWPSGRPSPGAAPSPQAPPGRPQDTHSENSSQKSRRPQTPGDPDSHLNRPPAPWSHTEKEGGLQGLTASDTS
ncbi:basic salivary proline-rich protein 1-like [Moschus berezovskii]|uniref:basic salivary proline-rich protein 1-like n=1 Tax=Moschus berezovskii TaxID=68408 RepID=UPI002444DCA7|nr:basic salivary proline-rich protein 1-like [Moschus berezovskii]